MSLFSHLLGYWLHFEENMAIWILEWNLLSIFYEHSLSTRAALAKGLRLDDSDSSHKCSYRMETGGLRSWHPMLGFWGRPLPSFQVVGELAKPFLGSSNCSLSKSLVFVKQMLIPEQKTLNLWLPKPNLNPDTLFLNINLNATA